MESPNPIASLGLRFDNVKIALETLCATADLLELTTDAADISEPLRAAISQIRSFESGNTTDAPHLFLDFYQNLRPSLQKVISDAFNHENNALLIELSAAVPDAVKEMLTISGLGPKRLREVWQTMGIQNEAQLYQATLENRLLHAKGFGPKTQAKIQQTLVARRKNGQAFFFTDLEASAKTLALDLETTLGKTAQFQLTGDLRAARAICKEIRFVVHSDHFNAVMIMLIRKNEYELMTAAQDYLLARIRGTEIPITFQFCAQNYELELFRSTGSTTHTQFLPIDPQREYLSEREIYSESGLHYLAPELREGREELMPFMNRNIEKRLIQTDQIQGLLHAHTSMSDGSDNLETMANACRALGMSYLGITDHAPSAWHGLGISEINLTAQWQTIQKLNKKLAPFKIYWGIEADIQADGSLGMSDEMLAKFDFVIAGLHDAEMLSAEAATMRCIQAIRNPYTRILAHPSGKFRLEESRENIDLDLILEECRKYDVAIELNCAPNRMDLDWASLRKAAQMGLMVAINPNAHNADALRHYLNGVQFARKGLLSRELCLNAKNQGEFEAWLNERSSQLK